MSTSLKQFPPHISCTTLNYLLWTGILTMAAKCVQASHHKCYTVQPTISLYFLAYPPEIAPTRVLQFASFILWAGITRVWVAEVHIVLRTFFVQFNEDPNAFGVNTVPNPPIPSVKSLSEADDSVSEISIDDAEPTASIRSTRSLRKPARKRIIGPKTAILGIAGLAAVVFRRQQSKGRWDSKTKFTCETHNVSFPQFCQDSFRQKENNLLSLTWPKYTLNTLEYSALCVEINRLFTPSNCVKNEWFRNWLKRWNL